VFYTLIEIKHNSASLRWKFCTYIQLIRGRFWLQVWTVIKFSEPRVSWKYLAKVLKNCEMNSRRLQRVIDGHGLLARWRTLRVSIYSLSIA